MPFLARAGFDAEPFDFRVPGVSSISCDTHKYGFAPKGSSTLLYRSSALRAYQYFVAPEWTGGVYASPGLPGSRPGALIAGCWASLMAQGENGYLSACHLIVGAAKRLESAIRQEPGLATDLCVLGRPLVSVVAFTATALSPVDIYDLADTMAHRGWHLNALQNPSAVHVAVTMPLAAALDQLIADLKSVVQELKEGDGQAVNADNVERSGRASNGKRAKKKGDAAALYGVAGSLPDKSVVVDLAKGYLDTLYKA